MSEIPKLIHAIRNPLNTISVNAELGKLVLEKKQKPELALKALTEILTQCEECANVIEELTVELRRMGQLD